MNKSSRAIIASFLFIGCAGVAPRSPVSSGGEAKLTSVSGKEISEADANVIRKQLDEEREDNFSIVQCSQDLRSIKTVNNESLATTCVAVFSLISKLR